MQDAEKAYAAGRFDDSAREYEAERASHPKDARLAIDAGAAAYRAGHYEAAEAALKEALTSADPKLQQQVLYDLGDARYRLGAATLADAPETTKARWKAAIDAYEGALALAPSDADARYNRDFVKRKLAELENKQKQQPQENQSKKDGARQGRREQGRLGKDQQDGAGKNGGPSKNGASEELRRGAKGWQGRQERRGERADAVRGRCRRGRPRWPRADRRSRDQRRPAKGRRHPPRSPAANVRAREAGPGGASRASTGKLSARDARALLDSLRGDERRGVSFATSGAPAPTDSPRRDW